MMEILEYRKNDDHTRIGFFDVRIPEWKNLTLRNLCHWQKGDKIWITFPSRKDGDKWMPYFEFNDKEMSDIFLRAARELLKEYLKQ